MTYPYKHLTFNRYRAQRYVSDRARRLTAEQNGKNLASQGELSAEMERNKC